MGFTFHPSLYVKTTFHSLPPPTSAGGLHSGLLELDYIAIMAGPEVKTPLNKNPQSSMLFEV